MLGARSQGPGAHIGEEVIGEAGGCVTITNRRDEKIAAWSGCVMLEDLGYGLGYRL